MKRSIPGPFKAAVLIIVFFSCTVISISGFDVGGNIENLTGISAEDEAELIQMDKVSLWFQSNIGDFFHLAVQGSWIYSIEKWSLPYPELLEFKGTVPLKRNSWPVLSINAGRFFLSDFSSNVIAHYIDGLKVGVGLPSLNVFYFGGYSGLLFKDTSQIIMSRMDSADRVDDTKFFGSPRVIGMAEIRFIELILKQDLTFSFVMQQEIRPTAGVTNDANGGKLSSLYSGAGLSGTLIPSLYWNGYFYLETGNTLSLIDGTYDPNTQLLAFLTGGGFRLFLDKLLFSAVELRIVFSSGDADNTAFYEGNTAGRSMLFIPISRPVQGMVFSPQLGNLFVTELSYSIKPFSGLGAGVGEKFQAQVKGLLFLRPTTGAISESYNEASTSLYLGTEVDGVFNFRPLSDLGLALTVGLFLPNNGAGGAFLETQRTTSFLGRFELSYSF